MLEATEHPSYPVLPLRDIVVFPHMIVPLFVGREKSVRALEDVMKDDKQILLVAQKNASQDDPTTDDIHSVGTIGTVLQLLKLPDGTATQDFQFSGNSIENSGTACMKFERVAGGTTGVFGNISIVGNEFAGCPTGLWFAGPGASGAVITGNNFSSISGFPIKLDPGANNIVVGQNTVTGAVSLQDNRTAFADEYGFLNRADTVAIDTSSSTNYAYAYHVTVPPFRSASIHLVLEGVIQGVGGFVRDEEFLLTNTGAGPLVVTQKSSTQGGSATIDFAVGTNTPGVADLGYRLNQGGRIQGTATIVPLGKMVSVSR